MYQNVEHAWGRMNNIPIVNVKIIKWIYVEILIIYSGYSYLVLIKIVKEFVRKNSDTKYLKPGRISSYNYW